MSVPVEQQVLWLQVTVDDVLSVQVVEGADYLWCVEVTCWAAEAAGIPQVRKQLSAADIVKEHVQERLVMVSPYPLVSINEPVSLETF